MRKLAIALALLGLVTTTGCLDTHTQYGECKGLLNKDEEDPALIYRVNTWNVVLAIVFSETLIYPGLGVGLWLYCPEAKKTVQP